MKKLKNKDYYDSYNFGDLSWHTTILKKTWKLRKLQKKKWLKF